MNITDPLVLPKGTVLTRVEDFPPGLRERLAAQEGEFAISRPQSRTPSRILDSKSAALIQQFETPKTIGQAVAYYSHSVHENAHKILEESLPMLSQLVAGRLLVPANSESANEIKPSVEIGTTVADCNVLDCVQALEDCEIYKVRSRIGVIHALKILRDGALLDTQRMFDREVAILTHLSGSVGPELTGSGVWKNRRYMLLTWCEGVDASTFIADLHHIPVAQRRKRLLEVCSQILRTYSLLHERKVIHADIHPRNILIDEANRINIVDFGLAENEAVSREFGIPVRGGIGFYFEPEYAESIRKGQTPPPATELGEQYSLAALLYLVLTGVQYLDFALTKEEMMRQILEDLPVPLAKRAIGAWPEVEAILFRALNKDPSARFSSVSEFADALSGVQIIEPDREVLPSGRQAWQESAIERTLLQIGWTGKLLESGIQTAPKASLTYGAAGIAYALYRISCQRQDSSLLSLADVWCSRAASALEDDDSFFNPEIEITPEIVGQISPYHTASGIHAVQALISHAMCDFNSQANAIDRFMKMSEKPCENQDLALGHSGTLLVSALLLDTLRDGPLDSTPLLKFGNDTLQSLWRYVDGQPSLREGKTLTYTGIAHGWAGILYATLIWCRLSEAQLPLNLEERLRQLAEYAEPARKGVRWPWVLPHIGHGNANYMPGWCNGNAGQIFLWTLAHQRFRDEKYIDLAEKSALHAWECVGSISNLCCGLAGQAYGLLNLFKHTGDHVWLDRAQELAWHAAAWDADSYAVMKMAPSSLYKGELGVVLLNVDLSAPENACMPFFEPEGWV